MLSGFLKNMDTSNSLSVAALGVESESRTVHAVSQTGRTRAIGKYVAKMPTAATAVNFSARHPERTIDRRRNRAVERRPETGPSSAAFELRIRREQRLTASGTSERAGALLGVQRAGAGAFRAMFTQNVKLLG